MAPNVNRAERPVELERIEGKAAMGKANSLLTKDHGPTRMKPTAEPESPAFYIIVLTYFSYSLFIVMGHVRDFLRRLGIGRKLTIEKGNEGFVPLYSDFESFFSRHLYRLVRDCWNRPVCGEPANYMTLIDRTTDDHNWTFRNTGTHTQVLNLASYNYLGFADGKGVCADFAIESLHAYGAAMCSPALEMGTYTLLKECEELIADFVGKEAALVVGMGFATNSTIIPSLVDNKCLVLSDAHNHTSIILGARLSGARIQVFRHNDMQHVEFLLRRAISDGQKKTHRPYKKILIIVEGLYSMEGTMPPLPQLVALKKKYKAYLYVDEAHSIGATGERGRGVCECYGVPPSDVDVLMGTFTKSFGAAGGYVASSKAVIEGIRVGCHGSIYATSMAAPVAAQIIGALNVIKGVWAKGNGEKRLAQIKENTCYFRKKLIEMGFIIYGNEISPVIPLLVFQPAKVTAFSRELLARNVGVVVVGYPAVPLNTSRARFCMSASHTREDLIKALTVIDEVGDILNIKLSRRDNVIGRFVP